MSACKTAAELKIGQKASLTHTVAEEDLALFAGATGDVNPIHFDQVYAERTFFKGRIAHGILSAGFISAVIANRLPGLGTIYVSQSLKFLAPVRIGDTITAQVEVLDVDPDRNRVRLRTTCSNQDGGLVLDGEAVVMPPKRKMAAEAETGIALRSESTQQVLESAVNAFAQALQETHREERLAAEPTTLWVDYCDQWMCFANLFQNRTDHLFNFWTDRTLRAQTETQELVQGWLEQTSKKGLELWSEWHRRMEQFVGFFQPAGVDS